jgi:hypothetical protein
VLVGKSAQRNVTPAKGIQEFPKRLSIRAFGEPQRLAFVRELLIEFFHEIDEVLPRKLGARKRRPVHERLEVFHEEPVAGLAFLVGLLPQQKSVIVHLVTRNFV